MRSSWCLAIVTVLPLSALVSVLVAGAAFTRLSATRRAGSMARHYCRALQGARSALFRAPEVVVEAVRGVGLAGLGGELHVAVDHLQVGVAHVLHELLDRVAGRHQERGVGVAALVERDAVEASGFPGLG